MKFNSYNMLAKANIKRGKKSNTVFVLLIISVILLTLVLAFSTTLNIILDKYVNNERARRFMITSWGEETKKLTTETLNEIRQIDHVVDIEKCHNGGSFAFSINSITDEYDNNCNKILPFDIRDTSISALSTYEKENIDVVLGKKLSETPIFSCIVPDELCFHNNYSLEEKENTLYQQSGGDFLSKILTVNTSNAFFYTETYSLGSNLYASRQINMPAMEYKLKVVGVYSTSDIPYCAPYDIFISFETYEKMKELAYVKAYGQDEYDKKTAERNNDPATNDYAVVVDNHKNVGEIQKKLEEMNIFYIHETEYSGDNYGTETFAAIFTGAANFLIVSMLLLTIINIFISVLNNIMERKSEIGLLKAVGYTNRQVFFTMYLEQLKIGLRAFVIGFTVSGIAVLIMNYINATGPFVQRKYIIDLTTFVMLGGVALLLVVLVPLICQLIALKRLSNITPRQAMTQK